MQFFEEGVTGRRLFRFKVDGHPNRSRVKWKKAVEPDCGLQANDAIGYALTREHYLALKVRGKILAGIKPSPDLQKESTPWPCLVLPDVFQTGTDLSRALQSFSRQSKPNSSSTLVPSSR